MQRAGARRNGETDMASANVEMNLFRRQLKRIPHCVLEQAPYVRKLNLSQNRGISLLGDLSKFVNVVELYLENCCLHDIPEELGNLSKVEVLTLSGNRLQHFERSATLDKLTTLKKLALNDCGLSQLPDGMGRLSMLEELDLQGNRAMLVFPSVLLRLSELRRLGLSACGLSRLPEGITKLTKLEELQFSDNKGLESLPRDLSALARLRVLNLWNCGFSEVPEAIATLVSLEELVLGENPLKQVPAGMWGLQNLRTLSFNECRLSELPADIDSYTSLEGLHIKGNQNLKTCPETVVNLPNLRMLSICRSGLSDLPREIGNLTTLTELKMSGIPFGLSLPPWLSELRNLRVLDISSCRLPLLPDAIAELTRLEVLDIYWNKELTSLPPSIGALRQLKSLDARICNLSQFPDVVAQLTSLEVLKLGGNRDVRHVPPSVAALGKLRALCLGPCGLTELPDVIAGLTSLEEINLEGNALGSFPEILLRLSKLRILNLSDCGLSALPVAINSLAELEDLNISKNKGVTSLTKEICALSSLKKLNVSYCGLTRLPDNCRLLESLEELSMRDVPITDELPPQLAHLKNLKVLDISSCGLLQLPSAIKELAYLEELYACNNYLQTYPDVTLHLKELRRLDLSNNNDVVDGGCKGNAICELPVELRHTSLVTLNLNGNPMVKPPKEICDRGVEAIRLYMTDLTEGLLICPDTVNMLGDARTGKTSVALSLRSGKPIAAADPDRSGDVMNQYEVAMGEHLVTINDFGGCEDYHAIIPILLSASGIFVITYNMSERQRVNTLEHQQKSVSKWLLTLCAKASRIRVAVVGTHADEVSSESRRKELEEGMAQHIVSLVGSAQEEISRHIAALSSQESSRKCSEKLDQLKQTLAVLKRAEKSILFVTLSSTGNDLGRGFETLLAWLEKQLSPGSSTPVSWRLVMNFILQRNTGRPYLKWSEIRQACMHYLPEDEHGEKLKGVLRYLADKSKIIWLECNPHLKEIIFHQPKRLVELLVKVVCHKPCPQMENVLGRPYYEQQLRDYSVGYLNKAFFAQLLTPHYILDVVSELLVQFNIISPINSERFVITSNLQSNPPQTCTIASNEAELGPSVNVRLSFLGSHMPLSFFPTTLTSVLSWAHSVHADAQPWKQGTSFRHNRVNFLMQSSEGALNITASSRSPNEDLWSVLHPVLEKIGSTVDDLWKGAPPLCVLTCPGCRHRERLQPKKSQHGHPTALYELTRADPSPTSAVWSCAQCQMDIPSALCLPRLPGCYSKEDMDEVIQFLEVLGTTLSLPAAETYGSTVTAPKRRRTDSSKSACLDEVDDACNQLTSLGMKFKKKTAILIQRLEKSDILTVADHLHADFLINMSKKEEIVNEANSSRDGGARSLIDFLSRQGDEMINAFLEVLSGHLEKNDLAEQVRNAAIP